MPIPSGPYAPSPGVPFLVENPVAGAGAGSPGEIVIVNLSPYELQISTADRRVAALIDPFMRDRVLVDLSDQTEITIEPLDVGYIPPAGIVPTIFVLWYLKSEPPPAQALPVPIVPFGNLQTVTAVQGGGWTVTADEGGTWAVEGVAGGVALPVSGAVIAGQGAPPWAVEGVAGGVALPVSGTVTADQGGTWTVDQGAPPWAVEGSAGGTPLPVVQIDDLNTYTISSRSVALAAGTTTSLFVVEAGTTEFARLTGVDITLNADTALPAIRFDLYRVLTGPYYLLPPPAAPTVTPEGTTGSTTYDYQVTASTAGGQTTPSTVGTTTAGNATLSATSYNLVAWAAVPLQAGSVGNLVYDSNLANAIAAVGPTWRPYLCAVGTGAGDVDVANAGSSSAEVVFHGAGIGNQNGVLIPATIQVTPGATYTVSAYIDATQATAGYPAIEIFDPTISTAYATATKSVGSAGIVSTQWTVPAGVTQVVVTPNISNSGGLSLPVGSTLTVSQIQLTETSTVQTYAPGPLWTYDLFGRLSGSPSLIGSTTALAFEDTGQALGAAPPTTNTATYGPELVAGTTAGISHLDTTSPAPDLSGLIAITGEPSTVDELYSWWLEPFGGGLVRISELPRSVVIRPGDQPIGLRAVVPAGSACNVLAVGTLVQ